MALAISALTACGLALGPTAEPAPTLTRLSIQVTASISGRVWHDLCALPLGEQVFPVPFSPGCVPLADSTYQANGQAEPGEPGLTGLRIVLGEGACPGTPRSVLTSGEDGVFSFVSLAPGHYRVSVDANAPQNSAILGAGRWTEPASSGLMAAASREVVVASDEHAAAKDFGWAMRQLPTPGPGSATTTPVATPAGCTDRAAFVEDVTLPDGSPVVAGETFRKVWRLRNAGTCSCSWTPAYALVFSSGERMGGASVIPLATTVQPGGTSDVGVDLIAPTVRGTSRGYWLLRNDRGLLFGLPDTGVNPIRVEVAVVGAGTTVTGGWKGEYYPNRNLRGTPALARRDMAIDFSWDNGSPDSAFPEDGFSARWTGATRFDQAIYRFHVVVDDGARLWVDGNLLIDAWSTGSSREITQDLGMTRGEHTLRLEYFEARGRASVRLFWEKPRASSFPDWKGEYWPNADLSGAPSLTRNDARIDFEWGPKAPASGVPSDRFSVGWTRAVTFPGGIYRFSLRADDGVRLWIDDAAYNGIATNYAVRSFSLTFDLDQQSIVSRALP